MRNHEANPIFEEVDSYARRTRGVPPGWLAPATLSFNESELRLHKIRRDGIALYTDSNRLCFARLGHHQTVEAEYRLLTRLRAEGFPFPRILTKEVHEGHVFYVEESAGEATYGDLLSAGTPTRAVLKEILGLAGEFSAAQLACCRVSSGSLSPSLIAMVQDIPQGLAIVRKIHERISSRPIVLSHGDFNPFNLLSGAVIDIEDACLAVFGLDLVNNISGWMWFPPIWSDRYQRRYAFSREDVDFYVAKVDEHICTMDSGLTLRPVLTELFILAGLFTIMKASDNSKLLRWRLERLTRLLELYPHGLSWSHIFSCFE